MAWKRPGAQSDYCNLSSRAWIDQYDIVTDDELLTKDTYPNFNATLGTKMIGLGLPEDIEGPQICWSGAEYNLTRERAGKAV